MPTTFLLFPGHAYCSPCVCRITCLQQPALARRDVLLSAAFSALACSGLGKPLAAQAALDATQVGSYLPPAGIADLVLYR